MNRRPRIVFFALLAAAAASGAALVCAQPTQDLLIRNARVIDGSGSPWYTADIAVRAETEEVIDLADHAPRDHR